MVPPDSLPKFAPLCTGLLGDLGEVTLLSLKTCFYHQRQVFLPVTRYYLPVKTDPCHLVLFVQSFLYKLEVEPSVRWSYCYSHFRTSKSSGNSFLLRRVKLLRVSPTEIGLLLNSRTRVDPDPMTVSHPPPVFRILSVVLEVFLLSGPCRCHDPSWGSLHVPDLMTKELHGVSYDP